MLPAYALLFVLISLIGNRAVRALLVVSLIWYAGIIPTLFFALRNCVVLWKAWRYMLSHVTAGDVKHERTYMWTLLFDPYVTYMRLCFILLMYASTLSLQSPIRNRRNQLDIYYLLREPGLQRVRILWMYNALCSAARRVHTIRLSTWTNIPSTIAAHLVTSAGNLFDYFCDGGLFIGFLFLLLPLWLFLNIILLIDCLNLLHVQLSHSWGSSLDVELVLRDFRYHLWFSVTPTIHIILLGAALFAGFDDCTWLLLLIFPISLNANLILFLTFKWTVTYLAASTSLPDPHLDAPFCSVCRTTVLPCIGAAKLDEKGRHHRSCKSLRKSALEGCRICRAVWKHRASVPVDFLGLLRFWKPTTSFCIGYHSIEIVSEACIDRFRNTCRFRIIEKNGNYSLKCLHHILIIVDLQTSLDFTVTTIDYRPSHGVLRYAMPADTRLLLKRIGIDTDPIGWTDYLSQARKWFENCRNSHGTCSRNIEQLRSFTPTRLIHIPDEYISLGVHLIQTGENRRQTAVLYTTLSHCWGAKTPIKLVKMTQKTFQDEGIRFDQLPRTFQHAIIITKCIGIDFIWIDSLCIIQDCAVDWKKEARSMCEVYTHTVCNIAAADSHDSTEGCLFSQDSRIMRIEKIGDSTYLANETDLYPNHPLYDRAWVFQESFLAPRAIDCGRAQLFWKCAELRASEVFPLGVNNKICAEYHPAMRFDDYSFRRYPILDINHVRNRQLTVQGELDRLHSPTYADLSTSSMKQWTIRLKFGTDLWLYTQTHP
jgi:hypothetical protein